MGISLIGVMGVHLMIKYDNETKKWFEKRIGQQTTVCRCNECGLFYKHSLGHKCKKIKVVE